MAFLKKIFKKTIFERTVLKKTIICFDRDGTLVYDQKYHLGSTNDWKEKVKVLPTVIKGIKRLRKLPGIKLYMITNQPGVAVQDFPLLTLQRAHDVCKYILQKFEKKGAALDGYFICPHASPSYVKKHGDWKFSKDLVCNCSCIKPGLGMVFSALKAEGIKKKDVIIYVVGDRASDVKMALSIHGTGILVPFKNEPEEEEKTEKMKVKIEQMKLKKGKMKVKKGKGKV